MNTLDWLSKLISFDTTSHRSNLDLIHCIQDYLSSYTISSQLTYDSSKTKANLFATLGGENKKHDGIILSGHTDVVPVTGQQWHTPPFTATQIENKIVGRGASDMKGFIAVILALVPEFKKLTLKRPLHLAFSYDEEVGCNGAPLLIEEIKNNGIQPSGCIVGEPTSMRIVIAHKGAQLFRCRIQGLAAHSSLTPKGCNAIEYAAELICYIRQLARSFREQGQQDPLYDVPFTTLTTNLIAGGNAKNIIPAECEFTFELRHLPQENANRILNKIKQYIQTQLLPEMQREYQQAVIELFPLGAVPGFEVADNSNFVQFIQKLATEKTLYKVAYATEAGLFQAAHIPTLICGPGNIEQAHKPNEFIEIAELEKCTSFLKEVVANYLV